MASELLRWRPLSTADLDWLVAQERALHLDPWTRGHFQDSLSAGYSGWLMSLGEEPIGYAFLLYVLDEAHLLNISIIKARQSQGWGAQFLSFLLSSAQQQRAAGMFLEVRVSNQVARKLYQQVGFTEIGRRKRYYAAPGNMREDAVVMKIELQNG